MSKIILQEGDIAYAVIDLDLAKYRCEFFCRSVGIFDKNLVLVPYNQKMMYMEQLKPIYRVNGLEEYVFTNWRSAKIYQVKKLFYQVKKLFGKIN